MIESIEQEACFHTIVVMRTKEVSLASKFPHTIFSKNDRISYEVEKEEKDFDYNVEIDAFKVIVHERTLVLANFTHVTEVFQLQKWKKEHSKRVILAQNIKNMEKINFFVYLTNKDFVPLVPLAVINNTIVFLCHLPAYTLEKQYFQDIDQLQPEDIFASEETLYHFSSEFGLLSDLHFFNNFVRGRSQFSSYKKSKNHYIHLIDIRLLLELKLLLLIPHL